MNHNYWITWTRGREGGVAAVGPEHGVLAASCRQRPDLSLTQPAGRGMFRSRARAGHPGLRGRYPARLSPRWWRTTSRSRTGVASRHGGRHPLRPCSPIPPRRRRASRPTLRLRVRIDGHVPGGGFGGFGAGRTGPPLRAFSSTPRFDQRSARRHATRHSRRSGRGGIWRFP